MAGKFQDPKGGLNPAGRKKFGVKKGVTSYSSASPEGKKRWVRWALRFTKTPQPLRKPNGEPTRYALMFRAWGEPVPTTAAAVTAVHTKALARRKTLGMGQDAAELRGEERFGPSSLGCDECPREFLSEGTLFDHLERAHLSQDAEEAKQFGAKEREKLAGKGAAQKDGSYPIRNGADLKNAIQAYGRSSNKAATKAHIIKRAKALGLTNMLPEGWDMAMHVCDHEDCERAFLDLDGLSEHAAAVHTFEDTRQAVNEALREKYGVGIAGASKVPYEQRTYVYVRDIAEDWVVFDEEKGGGVGASKMKKIAYAIDASGTVTFTGDAVEVVRKTVYQPKKVDGTS